MKIFTTSDHAGFPLKEELKKHFPFEDLGTLSAESVDYPIYADRLTEAINSHKKDVNS